ncbi:MAG: class I SAM-dependent methyltransferase [Anaerocolumna aminovalerica]|jgi:tRNA (cmo5U34)-methyltransferase|uniref:class I SAM-dependent methyltransferase n=1 Tax=Anaerocolumna aminovalerica TaxID=1527 RepID=UPI000BE23EB5|nr:class I SAM-dependent methyltransferase [Anaerocolumna aminovalerica]MBU5330701.1 class I SAM-dependent methyltransferase [Anaerocolumna aminovalerica]MDU6264441.1 class I SAM-dependent methyltransferase [Anaerocolumna aminovalerica]
MKIEKMSDFFTARVDGYDDHMLNNVEGCKDGYIKMAELLPPDMVQLLDLGCGTGLELDEIFKRFPFVNVTGIDLTKAMLDQLKRKHPDKNMVLINESYFDYDFGTSLYDAAVSFQTMHHFSHDDKIKLYSKILAALKEDGQYIECDYMLEKQEDEDFYFSENKRLRKEYGIKDGEFYHYDTPCTISNQIDLLLKAGFQNVEMKWREGNTTLLVAKKY